MNIFYGAGKNAEQHLNEWLSHHIIPVCFTDADIKKQGVKFCGYDVLSLDQALDIYPDSDIYITLASRNLLSATQTLLEQGVAKYKIKYFEDVAYGKGCWQLEGHMHSTAFLKPCCHWHYSANDSITITGEWQADYSKYVETIDELKRSLLNDEPCGCSGCAEVCEGLWSREFTPRLFALHDDIKGERCNCRCIYCNLTKSGGNMRDGKFTAIELLEGFGDFFPEKTMFYYAPAELTVSPYKKEIYSFLRGQDWEFSVLKTSGILYDAVLAEFMKNGGRINVSLDSGTKETYYKVKGIDCFGRVLQNIRHYRGDGAKIELKYILIEGLNDREEDLDGFIDICLDTADQIIITVDMNTLETGISASMWHSLEYLAKKAKETKLPIRLHSEHLSNENYERLSRLVC